MGKIIEERRAYPRVKINLRVNISKNISGNSVDLSEGGLSFILERNISPPVVSLQIHFSDGRKGFKTNAKLIWRRNFEGGSSLYGVEFVTLNENQKVAIRKEVIRTKISGLLENIKKVEIKNHVSRFFSKDILNYMSEMVKLNSQLTKGDVYNLEPDKKLERLTNQILLKGYYLELLLGERSVMERVKDNFRQLLGVWAYKSQIVKHAFDKPRGYPGDYKILEIIYDNKPVSKNIGLCFDNYFLKNPYAVAVRNRKDHLREMLQKFIHETKLAKIHILNIACGSCREIRELVLNLRTEKSIIFTCVDWDEEALKFSQDMLSCRAPENVKFEFVKEDVMNIIKEKASIQFHDKQNLVYSIGLIDYLPDRVLKRLIQVLYQFLEKDGKLILTHKNREKTFPPIPPDWFCNWKFVPRSKEEVVKIFYNCGIPRSLISVESDDFGYIYYFTITKK